MIANLKVNIILGFVSFLFTYLFSFVNNTWQTSLFRSILGFLVFFILGLILRFLPQQNEAKETAKSSNDPLNEGVLKAEEEPRKKEEKELESEPSFQSIPLDSLHNLGSGKETK
ncbi:hypothetical protein V7111_17225 [Neobacillus niacini]|uniref:hypothetical protein n=1 Tax=Neobacillus niacini TaxID=86668 RepID=UPI00300142F9